MLNNVTHDNMMSKEHSNMEWILNEWMNDAFIYCFIVYCCTPKVLYNHVVCVWGGGGGVSTQPPPVRSIHLVDVTAATEQQRQCAHHTPVT